MEYALLNKEKTTISLFAGESFSADIGQFGRFPLYQYEDLFIIKFQ